MQGMCFPHLPRSGGYLCFTTYRYTFSARIGGRLCWPCEGRGESRQGCIACLYWVATAWPRLPYAHCTITKCPRKRRRVSFCSSLPAILALVCVPYTLYNGTCFRLAFTSTRSTEPPHIHSEPIYSRPADSDAPVDLYVQTPHHGLQPHRPL